MTPADAREILTRHLETLTGAAVHARQPDRPGHGLEDDVGTFAPTEQGAVDDTRDLDDIRAALVRLDLGTWGACAACGDPIEAEQLDRAPHTRFCAACAAAGSRR